MPPWLGDLELEVYWCEVLIDEPDYFFGKWCNCTLCKKTCLIFYGWCDNAVLNSLIP